MSAGEPPPAAPSDRSHTLPLRALVPNAITVLALCFGLTAVRHAMLDNWEKAVGAIIIAGVLDGLDGRIARLLKGASRFGAELDSLSDVIAFGVAPAIIIYQWSLHELGGVGWVVALSHAVCCALRLARFNANLDVDNQPHKSAGYLTGVPSPVAAGLTLSPIFFDLWLETEFFRTPIITAIIVAATAAVMVSNLPTYSWKLMRLRRDLRLPALLGIGLFAASLFTAPWGTLSLLSLAYAASIPMSYNSYQRMRLQQRQAATATGATAGAPTATPPAVVPTVTPPAATDEPAAPAAADAMPAAPAAPASDAPAAGASAQDAAPDDAQQLPPRGDEPA
ncbi:CDP-diacylglycerol--serine O-phosphatidyltransferase [Parapedomonas caeni]